MSQIDVFRQFVQRAWSLQTKTELFRLLEDVTFEIGFHYFALINHVDLRLPKENIIRFDNYPDSWAKHFVANGLYVHDPILQASLTSNFGFAWSDVPKMINVTNQHRTILKDAARNGLGEGYTVPANIPGEYFGSCSFATKPGVAAPVTNFPLAQLIGAFAYEAARRLTQGHLALRDPSLSLTPRQRDCLLWSMRGKTDWEIGRILGLSEETVSKHLDMARERYGVSKRLQLAVRAIFDGQISLMEVLFE